jgi:hypothetical protein
VSMCRAAFAAVCFIGARHCSGVDLILLIDHCSRGRALC